MNLRGVLAFAMLLMIAASMGMALTSVERAPEYLHEPSARFFLLETALVLVAYGGAILVIVTNRGQERETELRNATMFGGIAGACEVVNVAIENGYPIRGLGPLLQIAGMLLLFMLWGIAGARTAAQLGSIRSGVIAAVMSAGICMVIGVTAGFVIELFVAPPQPGYVATWVEYQRSGWTDPRAFGVANTLDSGFTHLVMGPLIALIVGGAAAWLGRKLAQQHRFGS
jgi:hypothetical protein